MAHDDGDGDTTRVMLHRLADAAGSAARVPDVAGVRSRARRRRHRRAVTGAVALAAAVAALPAVVVGTERADSAPIAVSAAATGAISHPAPSAAPPSSAAATPIDTSTGVQTPGSGRPPPATVGEVRRVQLWLLRQSPGQRCPEVLPVDRDVTVSDGVAKQALRALLDGPTAAERAQGFTSAFHDDADKFRYLKLSGRKARADFSDLDALTATDRCEKAKVLEPLERTLEQFPWIEEAHFSVRGDERAFYIEILHDRVP